MIENEAELDKQLQDIWDNNLPRLLLWLKTTPGIQPFDAIAPYFLKKSAERQEALIAKEQALLVEQKAISEQQKDILTRQETILKKLGKDSNVIKVFTIALVVLTIILAGLTVALLIKH